MAAGPDRLKALSVRLHGREIGIINRLAGDRQLFAFEQAYVDDPDRATLSLSFKGREGSLITTPRSYAARVPPFFSNLLPEGPLRSYLAAHAGVKPEREFFLLAVLGADLPGALTVTPLDQEVPAPAGAEADDGTAPDAARPVLRFSLAGVQLKFSAVLEAAGGLTIPAHGMGGAWIVKLPSPEYPAVPENEFVMLELAAASGMDVPERRLVPVDQIKGLPPDTARLSGQALAVRRFDRGPEGQRIHMEDFAQVFGQFPEAKYDHRSYASIARVLRAETNEESNREFLRRLAFTVLTGNGDMHLKNWSLLYPDTRTPVLAPAYDLVSTVPYIPGDELGLTLGGSRSLHAITKDQIRRFADTAGLPVSPTWNMIREIMDRAADAWHSLDARDVLPESLRTRIEAQIDATAKATER